MDDFFGGDTARIPADDRPNCVAINTGEAGLEATDPRINGAVALNGLAGQLEVNQPARPRPDPRPQDPPGDYW